MNPATSPTEKAPSVRSPYGTPSPRFDRPATVISESPDEKSHQEIKAILTGAQAKAR